MVRSKAFRVRVFNGILRRVVSFAEGFAGIRSRAVLWLLGVEYGRGFHLHGAPIISMRPGSKLSIGNDCRLRSSSHGNAIGVNHPVVLRTLAKDAILSIGDRFGMSGGSICAVGSVVIGDRVLLGANVVISDSDFHSLDALERAHSQECTNFRVVVVEDDVWIGADAYVCKGVTIGRGAIVGAKSVVTHDVPPFTVVAGNPARFIRQLENPFKESFS